MLGSFGLLLNLMRLQIVQADELRDRALQQQQVYLNPPPSRRPIVDRSGNAIALDRPVFTLYAHPTLFKISKPEMAQLLSPVLQQSEADLLQEFNAGETGLILNRDVTEAIAEKIADLRQDGLDLIPRYERIYPQQELFSSIVGYVDTEGEGRAGLEMAYQPELHKTVTGQWLNRTGEGNLVSAQVPFELIHQDDLRLQLTLDSRLHRFIQPELQRQVARYGAKRGAVLVMDAQDGSLLAMVQEPTYDPNQYYEADVEQFRSWVLTDLYEPGSTFKPFNVAIALEAGVLHPNDSIPDEGRIMIGEWPIENFDYSARGGRGSLTIEEVLKYSSNVAMVHIMERLKPEDYYEWLVRCGFDKLMGTDLPFEVAPQIKEREQFIHSRIEPATASFGQGLALSPIKLLQLHGAIANGGKLVVPHVVKGLVNTDGNLHWKPNLPAARPVFSPATTQAVVGMMEAVVRDGTGKPAQIPNYRVAGKTGTAQKASPYGGYYTNAKITSFVSIFPADKPRYVILAVVDEPQGDNAFGSTVAAPLVKSAIEALISVEGIPPSPPAQ
jgi:cell division protein FtsI (penicillin-binding protein 3)